MNLTNITVLLTLTGGTGLYVHKSIISEIKIRQDPCFQIENGFESTFIELIQCGSKNIIIGCLHKHPSFPVETFTDEIIVKIFNKINRENKLVTVMGDFNINLLNYDTSSASSNFYDSIASFNFQPLILQPSRITLRSQTLIDNIFTNDIKHDLVSGNLTCSISDHFAQFAV